MHVAWVVLFTFHWSRDDEGLFVFRFGGPAQNFGVTARRPVVDHRFRKPALNQLPDLIRSGNDCRPRPAVPFNPEWFDAPVPLVESDNVLDVRTPPLVDRLVVVADHA